MAITIKCPDCGRTKQSDDGEPETCPECEGTMAPPPKKKYQAKSTSLEDEERVKKKSRPRDDEDERPKAKKKAARDEVEEDEKPAKKKKPAALSLDDEDDEEVNLDFPRDGKAAERLELDPGFDDKALMRQVAREMSRGEVLHFACRPSMEVAKKQAMVARIAGAAIMLLAVIFAVVVFAVDSIPKLVVIVPVFMVVIGLAFILLGPKSLIRQAERGWYAVTDRRAITFAVGLWGERGDAKSYEPHALRKMYVKKSFWVKGAGDLVFHTEITDTRTKWVDKQTGRTVRQTGHRHEQHYGFLGIDDLKDVEALIHEILLSGDREDDDDDE